MKSVLVAVATMLVLAAAPSLAQSPPPAVAPIETYGRLPAMEKVTLSPSGDRMAFVAFDGAERRLFVRSTAGQALAVMPLSQAKVRNIYWGGERFVLLSVSETVRAWVGGPLDEAFAVFIMDIQTGKVTPAFGMGVKVWKVVLGEYGTAEVNGRWVAYFSGLEQVRQKSGAIDFADYEPDLFKVDLESGDIDLINNGRADSGGWVVRDGEVAARASYLSKTGEWSIASGETGPVLLKGQDRLNETGLNGLGRDRDHVVLSVYGEDGWPTLRELSLTTGAEDPPLTKGVFVTGTIRDPVDGRMVGYRTGGDAPAAVYLDPDRAMRAAKTLKPFAGKGPVIVSTSRAMDRLIVFTNGGDDSGTYWLVDLKSGKADILGEQYPRIGASKVGPTRIVQYKAADGLALDGVLTLPPGREPKNLPVIVLPHGGPEARDSLGFDWWAQAFASRGYAVFQPNFRGSGGAARALRDAGFGEWGRKMQTDVSDGLAALAAQGIVDPKRACVVGGSYGGYVALAGVTLQQGVYRCAAAWGGVYDPQAFLNTRGRDYGARTAGQRYWRAFLGADIQGRSLSDISPVAQAARADAPVLLLHGKEDSVVDISQSQAMAKALQKAGKTVQFVTLDGEDHWLSGEATRTAMLKATLEFVQKYNPPE
jgi:dipeptidyl aminopeptidase/acylaminoacyl peptidase